MAMAFVAAFASGCSTAVRPVELVRPADPLPSTAVASPPATVCQRGHTVVLVRHAEKASTDRDPDLSDRGRERAKRLSALLASAGPTRLVASPMKRTQQTLAPLAERAHLTVEVQPAERSKDLARELARAPEGSVTVVASHSNIVPMLVRELGGGALPGVGSDDMLADDDFGRILVLTLPCPPAKPIVVELRSDPVGP